MKKINNLHDKFVRASFSDTDRAIAFFEKFLPEFLQIELDLSTLRPLQESYILGDLNEHFSDIIFEVSSKINPDTKADIVLLFEHKSIPDKNVLIQVGHYMFSHWFRCIREKRKLKVIIPLVYYQGKKTWTLKPISELFDIATENIKNYIPEIKHLFIALKSLSDDAISDIRDKMMAVAVMTQKNSIDIIKLSHDLEKIFRLFPQPFREGNFLDIIFVYIISVSEISKKELLKALEAIPQDLKENFMTTYTWIKEEGEQIGIQKKEIEVILKGYDKGLKISLLANITNLSEAEVQNILIKNNRIKG